MFAFTFSAALLAASAAPAMAALIGRQGPFIPASCGGLPYGSFGSPSYNFTLSATTADGTDISLVLALGPPGSSPAASEWVIAVRASDPAMHLVADAIYRPQTVHQTQMTGRTTLWHRAICDRRARMSRACPHTGTRSIKAMPFRSRSPQRSQTQLRRRSTATL